MMKRLSSILIILIATAWGQDYPGKLYENRVVGLDNYYNHEFKSDTGQPFHYLWDDHRDSGFSGMAAIIQGLGAKVTTLTAAPAQENLRPLSLYIIVDPDTPKETANPNYLAEPQITAIVDWVQNGGILVLMANDSGNCELDNLNLLAARFGVQFTRTLRNRVIKNDYAMGCFAALPDHPLFTGVDKIYIKEISTLMLKSPALPVLVDGADVIMAFSRVGEGAVFAVGDPWLYNEYLDGYKLPPEYENTKAANNLFLWLLGMAKTF